MLKPQLFTFIRFRVDDLLIIRQTRPANAAGFLIHSEIHKARPDVAAICHAHTDAGRAWSVFAKPLDMLNQDICNFHNAHAVYADYGGIVFAQEEGQNIAKSLGAKNKVSFDSPCLLHGCCSVAQHLLTCIRG